MKIVKDDSLERWQEWRELRLQALKDVPQAFLDDYDEATAGLEPDEYVAWLEKNPSAKNTLIKFAKLRDRWSNE